MASRLSDCLVDTGLASPENVRAAIARQAVYGGALDTALLELGALEEPTLWDALGQATGLPLPDPVLYESPAKHGSADGAPIALDAVWSERCRAVPAGLDDGALQLLCGEPVARAEIDAASARLGIPFVLYVVPEVRLAAVRQAVYDRPMPPRLVRVFARIAGTQPVRRWHAAHAKPLQRESVEGVEILERRPPAASPALPVPSRPAAKVDEPAASSPTPLKVDKSQVEALIARLRGKGSDPEAAHAALVAISKQDHGPRPRRWEMWWKKHQEDDRVEWLFDGLSHKTPEIRASAEEELRALTGEYFGYHFDLPRRERDEARARWQSWWYESGRARRS